MRDLRAPAGTRGARYALAAVAVALFGLLSIGPLSHDHSGPAASEPDTSEPIVAGHPVGMSSEEPIGENGAGLLGLCLAVLAGLVLGIALLLVRRGVRIPRTLLPAWQPRLFIGRDRDPPSLGMLCVIRC